MNKTSVTHKAIYEAVLFDYESATQSASKYIALFKADPSDFKNAMWYAYHTEQKNFYKAILDCADILQHNDFLEWLKFIQKAIEISIEDDVRGSETWTELAYETRQKVWHYKLQYISELLENL